MKIDGATRDRFRAGMVYVGRDNALARRASRRCSPAIWRNRLPAGFDSLPRQSSHTEGSNDA